MNSHYTIIAQPSGRRLHVDNACTLAEALTGKGFSVSAPCGGNGTCGKCRVRILDGADAPTTADEEAFTIAEIEAGMRLACQNQVTRDIVIELEDGESESSAHRILAESTKVTLSGTPTIRSRTITREECRLAMESSEADAISEACGGRIDSHRVLIIVSAAMREKCETLTVTLHDDSITAAIPGRLPGPLCGIALDIGTTTLAATLVDIERGEDLASAGAMNPQSMFGDDVLARVRLCREEPDGLERLRSELAKALASLFEELLEQAGVPAVCVRHLSASGNTAMQQIFAGLHPEGLGELPFAPVTHHAVLSSAGELGLPVLPAAATVELYPQVSGFVGGDLVAGLVATGFDRLPSPALFIDVGTNGEMALIYEDQLLVTSVAAGPAFEGARIRHGMRATSGAIENVVLNGDVEITVIGDSAPRGLCGSALIDAVAELLRQGIVDATGRFVDEDELPEDLPAALKARIISEDDAPSFLLAENSDGSRVCLSQRDVRELQLANGAIRAGASILLQEAGVDPKGLQHVLVAGGFGNYIRRENACRIGMLPADMENRILFAGNTALLGAKMALLARAARSQAEELRRKARHVDLSANPAFQMEFADAMMFPEAD